MHWKFNRHYITEYQRDSAFHPSAFICGHSYTAVILMKKHELVLFVIHLLTVNALKVMLIKTFITIMFSCVTF